MGCFKLLLAFMALKTYLYLCLCDPIRVEHPVVYPVVHPQRLVGYLSRQAVIP
jgi:hypothetical protein